MFEMYSLRSCYRAIVHFSHNGSLQIVIRHCLQGLSSYLYRSVDITRKDSPQLEVAGKTRFFPLLLQTNRQDNYFLIACFTISLARNSSLWHRSFPLIGNYQIKFKVNLKFFFTDIVISR